jgi:hypothetical protein
LAELQIASQRPTLTLTIGDRCPHVRGKLREYVSL